MALTTSFDFALMRCSAPKSLARSRRSVDTSSAMTRAPMATASCVADKPTGNEKSATCRAHPRQRHQDVGAGRIEQPVLGDGAPQIDRAVSHDNLDRSDRGPVFFANLGDKRFANFRIGGRCRRGLLRQAGECMEEIGATDDTDQPFIVDDGQTFDASFLHQRHHFFKWRVLGHECRVFRHDFVNFSSM